MPRRRGAPALGSLFEPYPATEPPHLWVQVIIDTNFINFSIRNKIDLVKVRGSGKYGRGW